MSEEEKADRAYEVGRVKALAVLDNILTEMLYKTMDRDTEGYDHFRKKYTDLVEADEGNFLGSLTTDVLTKLHIYDALFAQVITDNVPSSHVELYLGKLKEEYEDYKKDMDQLKKNHDLFVDAVNAQLTLANKYVANGGRDDMERIGKLMNDFDTWLTGKIEERHPHVSKLFQEK
ncbi:Uncharacterised protein [uncultured archaeon]|nr:Uncharacterised protein [uncultured archaeon]